MLRRIDFLLRFVLRCAALVAAVIAAAAAPTAAKTPFDVAPPGRTVQEATARMRPGAALWHVILSRKLLGMESGKVPAYQWYLSFYAPGRSALRLVYQLPNGRSEDLSRVTKVDGADLYFPHQDVRIAGVAPLQHAGASDVVVLTYESGADCGSANVLIFGADGAMHVHQLVAVENGCDLRPKIVKHGARWAVQLTGPYYGPRAAMCCPTRPHASALLEFVDGAWHVTPRYFSIARSTRR